MKIPSSWHPFEIIRKWRLFWADFYNDFELRHPETRRRLSLEISIGLVEESDQKMFQNIILRFQQARRVISFLDWPLLLDWNERRLQALCLIQIQKALGASQSLASNPLQVKIAARLRDIQNLIRAKPIEDPPRFINLIANRLKFSALREESSYLSSRVESLRQAA